MTKMTSQESVNVKAFLFRGTITTLYFVKYSILYVKNRLDYVSLTVRIQLVVAEVGVVAEVLVCLQHPSTSQTTLQLKAENFSIQESASS